MTHNLYALGLDLGKYSDKTVLSWAQYFPKGCGTHRYFVEPPNCCHLRRIEPFPLNIKYPAVVDYVVRLVKVLQTKGEIVSFYWDGTGNLAFTDYMDKAIDENHLQVNAAPYIFTGGQAGTKMELISNMKLLHSTGQLVFDPGKNEIEQMHIKMLIEEMKRYEDRRLGSTGKIELGVFESGEHDDMVTSCALAVKDFVNTVEKGAFIGVIPSNNKWVETPMGTAGDLSEAGLGYVVPNVNIQESPTDFPF